MTQFSYQAPASVEATVALLVESEKRGLRTQFLAGGTDVLVQMRTVDREPRLLIDVKKLAETNTTRLTEDQIYIGAAIPTGELYENQQLRQLLPGLMESADLIGSTQIQGRATIGGNLCNASPAGDTIPALIANRASCVVVGPAGQRSVPVEHFVVGVGKHCLLPNELLLGFNIPMPQPRTKDAYLRFIPRTEMDIAVAGAGVSITLDKQSVCVDARVGIGAVAPTPLLVSAAAECLIGSRLEPEVLDEVAHICAEIASPITDKRGTKEYRRRVIGVLCRRACLNARDRIESTN